MQLCFKDTPATDWAQLFPDASRDAVDLLSQLGQWNPGQCPEVLHSAWEQTLLHQVRFQNSRRLAELHTSPFASITRAHASRSIATLMRHEQSD